LLSIFSWRRCRSPWARLEEVFLEDEDYVVAEERLLFAVAAEEGGAAKKKKSDGRC
jgi:hypothetical protein